MTVVSRRHLLDLLRSFGWIKHAQAAIDAVDGSSEQSFAFGAAGAEEYLHIMRRRVKRLGAEHMSGWPELETTLAGLDADSVIGGLTLPNNYLVVDDQELARVLGCLKLPPDRP
jgi:hypothetical protein